LPTTGDPFTFVGNFSDNIVVSEVYVNYTINGVKFLPRSLVNEGDQSWTITIIIPPNGTNLSYHFHFRDNDGNTVTTSESSLEIMDNDLPFLMADGTPEQPTTGDELQFQTFMTDNIGISIVKVVYTFGSTNNFNESMSNGGRGSPEMFSKTVTVDPGAILVDYHYYMEDDSGNANVTETVVLFVSDNDLPTADAGEDIWIGQHTKVIFDGTNSHDNIELDEYEWSFEYEGNIRYIYGDDAKFTFDNAGVYEVTLNVTDTSGNWQNDTMTVTVNDTTDPTAKAGNDHFGTIGKIIKFDASSSADNVGIVEYGWGFMYNDSQVNISGKIENFTFFIPGSYEVLLVVKDATGNWGTDTVIVMINDETPPVADAGPDRNVTKGTTFRFNGTGSTDNAGIDNYTWSFNYNGTKMELYGISPEFRFDTAGTYTVKLRITDAGGNSKSDTMKLTVEEGAVGDDTDGPDDDKDPSNTGGDAKGTNFDWILIIGGIIVVLVVVFIIVFLNIKKKKVQEDEVGDEPLSDEGRTDIPEGTSSVSAVETATVTPAVSSIPLTEAAPTVAESPLCTGCGQPSQYYQEYNCYWCMGCQTYVYPDESSEAPVEDVSIKDIQQLPSPEEQEKLPVSSMDGSKEPLKALPEAQLDTLFELEQDEDVKAKEATEIPSTAEAVAETTEAETVQKPVEEPVTESAEAVKGEEDTQSSAVEENNGQAVEPETGKAEGISTGSENNEMEGEENEAAVEGETVEEEKEKEGVDADVSQEDTSSEPEEKTAEEVTAKDKAEGDGPDDGTSKLGEQEELDSMLDDLLVDL